PAARSSASRRPATGVGEGFLYGVSQDAGFHDSVVITRLAPLGSSASAAADYQDHAAASRDAPYFAARSWPTRLRRRGRRDRGTSPRGVHEHNLRALRHGMYDIMANALGF